MVVRKKFGGNAIKDTSGKQLYQAVLLEMAVLFAIRRNEKNNMLKWKVKKFFRNIWRYICFAFQLPHFITLLILLATSIACLIISINTLNSMLSSILSNIFAGLITGIAICLISGLRGLTIYHIKGKIDWLEHLHNDCLEFMKCHTELLKMKFDDLNLLYDKMYDTICRAGGINSTISQSQFNKKLSFNAIRFCCKQLDYNWEITNNLFLEIREKIINTDVSTLTKKELIDLFHEIYSTITILNGAIVNKLEELKTQQNMVNRFFV